MQTTHHSPTTLSYAQSLLELADEKGATESIGQELGQVAEIINQNPTFAAYLADPGISQDERGQKLRTIFSGQVSPLLWNFLGVLNLKGKLKAIPEISAAFDDLLDEKLGKIEVDVTVAHRLSADELEKVRQSVSSALKKDAVVHQYVDESIIGGLLIRVQDKLIDASVKAQLEAIRRQLLAAQPR